LTKGEKLVEIEKIEALPADDDAVESDSSGEDSTQD
jgi:hypothetical protein